MDGEAWQQTPATITVEKLPYQSAMLERSSKSFYQRGVAHRDVREMLQRASVPTMDLSQLGTRRTQNSQSGSHSPLLGSPTSPHSDVLTPPPQRSPVLGARHPDIHGLSHTLYIKPVEEEKESSSQ